jgi:hypothetical protein
MMQQKTGEVIDQAKEKAGQVVGQVQDQAKTQVSTQKDRLAEGLSSVSQALQQTGQQLQDQDVGPVGQYVNGAADQVDKIANYLKERDVDDILYEVESLARRQPAIFLGGALVLGLLGARFLRSSQQRAYEIQRREAIRSGAAYTGGPYGSTGYGTGAYSGMTGRGTAGGYGTTGGYSQGTGDPYETESLPIYSYDKEDTTLGRGTEG